MYHLRNTWLRMFNKAMALLRSKDHPIARYTVKLIESAKVKVLPYEKIRRKDYQLLREEYEGDIVNFPKRLPLARKTIHKLKTDWDGFIYENRLYISDANQDPLMFARTIVHELNHYINDSNDHYETDEDRFREECRASIAEVLVFGPQTRNYLTRIAKTVSDKYDMPIPEGGMSMPKGIFYK